MAPRGRRRKVGLTRMDAAIDALTPFGFSKHLVRKTVNALLKVYDGDSGWVFIEDASYKLVIESILEEQEKSLETKDDSPEHGNRDLDNSDNAAVGTSSEIHPGTITTVPEAMVGITDTDGQQNDPADNQIELGTETEGCHLLPPGENNSWKDISCVDYESKPEQIDTNSEHLITETYNFLSSYKPTKSAVVDGTVRGIGGSREIKPRCEQPESTPLRQRRKPCYGWISDDDEEDKQEALNAMEVPVKIETVMAAGDLRHRRRRKSRWDVEPSDM